MYKRRQLLEGVGGHSAFLWGARQTGKSTLLKALFPASPRYDLLKAEEFARLNNHPESLRQDLLSNLPPIGTPVIVDEIQKVPALMDEIHWLIENHNVRFIMGGSSARKLKRMGANFLGGRAFRYELFPLVSAEIPDFDLLRALNNGLLPAHYAETDARRLIQAYVGDYLSQEIAAEAAARNVPAFGRFLEAAAFSNGELVNYQNVASECGVSPHTAKEYFQILEDTLIGRFLWSFRRRAKRRVIQAPKFYFFDVGLAGFLLKRGRVELGGESFGRAFEHFIFQEIAAHSHYSGLDYPLSTWRTASQLEVDFILGDHEVAVEVKGTELVQPHHMRGLRAFQEEHKVKKAIVVSRDLRPRLVDEVSVMPWKIFLGKLWAGEII